jgi:hypothetical protein
MYMGEDKQGNAPSLNVNMKDTGSSPDRQVGSLEE